MAGFQSGSMCYATALEANAATALAYKGSLINLQSGPAIVHAVDSSANVVSLYLTPFGGGPEIEQVIFIDPSACIIPGVEDGVVLGWAVAACFFVAFGVMFLARAMRGETGGTYGES